MSFRDVEELPAQRRITVSYEAIRLWCFKFGPEIIIQTRLSVANYAVWLWCTNRYSNVRRMRSPVSVRVSVTLSLASMRSTT